MEITGRLTGDAQAKTTKDSRELVAFSLVINDRYKTKSGEKKEEATFFSCAYWQGTAIARHLKKGMIVTLHGRVGINSYKTREGDYMANLTFHANNIKIVASGKTGMNATQAASPTPEPLQDLPF
jgi:single-strand DNA-binding protein